MPGIYTNQLTAAFSFLTLEFKISEILYYIGRFTNVLRPVSKFQTHQLWPDSYAETWEFAGFSMPNARPLRVISLSCISEALSERSLISRLAQRWHRSQVRPIKWKSRRPSVRKKKVKMNQMNGNHIQSAKGGIFTEFDVNTLHKLNTLYIVLCILWMFSYHFTISVFWSKCIPIL